MEKATRKQILQMKATLDKNRSHLRGLEGCGSVSAILVAVIGWGLRIVNAGPYVAAVCFIPVLKLVPPPFAIGENTIILSPLKPVYE